MCVCACACVEKKKKLKVAKCDAHCRLLEFDKSGAMLRHALEKDQHENLPELKIFMESLWDATTPHTSGVPYPPCKRHRAREKPKSIERQYQYEVSQDELSS